MARITIDSILGGEAPMTHFAAKNQFSQSLGIDPAYPIDSVKNGTSSSVEKASGLLRPVGSSKFSGSVITSAPMWMVPNPKTNLIYVYDAAGSTYSIDPSTGPSVTALSDKGLLNTGQGDGSEYYDNYIYFATTTDLVRYGPLNGGSVFTGSYWQGTLGKTALAVTATVSPALGNNLIYPKMVLKRHSDGKMYIAHSSGNQGAISYVSTTKTTAEGDTDNGSTFAKLLFGYGLLPSTIESYGAQLAIALSEGSNTVRAPKAKLAFWDTLSQNFNSILWVEFPDQYISALKNIDGTLYIWSGNYGRLGCRVSRYVGGYSIKEVAYYEGVVPPMQGAVDGTASGIVFGSSTDLPEYAAAVHSIGLHKTNISSGQFKIMRASGTTTGSTMITSMLLNNSTGLNAPSAFANADPWVGWSNGTQADGTVNGIDQPSDDCSTAKAVWESQLYKIGEPFEIQRVHIPLAQVLAAGMTVIPTIIFDDGAHSQDLLTINSSNFPSSSPASSFGLAANLKTDATGSNFLMGQNNFKLRLRWSGTTLCTVSLPILIDFNIIPD